MPELVGFEREAALARRIQCSFGEDERAMGRQEAAIAVVRMHVIS